ncbi:MAG: hypothetical protein Q7U13_11040 [Rhodoferax sp.]|nr:hypothetical protein [Rhodoferax sp.]
MFSASEVAFSGFRAGREHFRTLLLWIPILGLFSFAMAAAMVAFAGPAMMSMQQIDPQAEADPRVALEAFKSMGAFYAVLLPACLLYYGVLNAAVNRLMLRPSDKRFAYFAFGADELRQVAVMVLMALIFFAIYILGVIGVVILVAAMKTTAGTPAAVAAGIFGGLAFLALFMILAVRLSLASAQTFATGRINLFGSWALTKGQFWPILGAYLLALVLALIAYAAVAAILMLVMVLVGGGFGALGSLFSPDMSSVQAYFTPSMLIYELLGMIPAPFLLLIMSCPAPDIYRSLVKS